MDSREKSAPEGYPVTIDGWFRSGLHTFRSRGRILMGGIAVLLAYSLAILAAGMLPGGSAIVIFVQLTVGFVLTAGWLNFCLRLVRGEDVSAQVIFEPFRRYIEVWSLAFVISAAVALGIFALILPGIYLMVRLGMGMFVVVDKGTGIAETLRISWDITRGHEWKLLVYNGILIGLYGLSVLPYLRGMEVLGAFTTSAFNFAVVPLLGVTYASAYDSLTFLAGRRE